MLREKEFQNLKKGDKIFVKMGDRYASASCTSDAYYNADCGEPGWEVETTYCVLSIDNDIRLIDQIAACG